MVGLFSEISRNCHAILTGNGDGTFQTFPSYPAPAAGGVGIDAGVGTMAVADFNGDGKSDLAIGEAIQDGLGFNYQVGLLLNSGAGFTSQVVIPVNMTGASAVGPSTVATDFNRDGKVDLAVGGSGVAVLLGNGDGSFQTEADYGTGMTGPLAVGDFNNDGNLDLLGGVAYSSDVAVILGNGNGSFGLPLESRVGPLDGAVIAFAVADLNRDG